MSSNISSGIGGDQQGNDSASVDVEAMRKKYREERERRLRPSGNEQFPELVGPLARFQADPFVDPDFTRPPVEDEVDVLVVGGGLGGLLAGAELRKAGVKRIRIVERAGDFGGVWYWNRYPGAMCDVESYLYLPLLEETGYMPTEKYAHQPEIFAYLKLVGQTFDLYDDALFQTAITKLEWDDNRQKWLVHTDRNDRFAASHVVMASGQQVLPRLPGIAGIEKFTGHVFHTSRWDYGYTGGNASGDMRGLADKRVGIIGTGATALQCAPEVAESAQQLFIFQRTPSTVSPRNNHPTDPAWAASLRPGWQRERMTNFVSMALGKDVSEDLVDDGWTYAWKKLGKGLVDAPLGTTSSSEEAELLDMELISEIHARIDSIVEDRETAEALKPYYRFWCKRPGFHDGYLPMFNRPNVTLVDTHGQGVDAITPMGVIVDGQEFELDCIVFATGFDVGHGYLSAAGFDLIGRDGLSLSQQWDNGLRTFHGFYAAGMPNCYFMGATQAGTTANFVHTLWEQAEHIAYVVNRVAESSATSVETTIEAVEEWQEVIHGNPNPELLKFWQDCTPGYFTSEGNVDNPKGILADRYPQGALAYCDLLREWREEGSLRGLIVK